MATGNIPGVYVEKQDGGLTVATVTNVPRILVLGTAPSGPSESLYLLGRSLEAAATFGSSGTLIRGMYESRSAGGQQILLYRIGATPAKLEGIGTDELTGGIVIETLEKDNTAADHYSLFWDDTAKRLLVKNVENDEIVFDRDFDNEVTTIDLGEVMVSGTPEVNVKGNLGSASAFVLVADVDEEDYTLTAGTDGTDLSRMQLYEHLFSAYLLLENSVFDYVVPMDVNLDDRNVVDGLSYTRAAGTTYPDIDSANDMLLYFYAEEYQGEWYFYWRETKASGAAKIYPANFQSTSPNGTDITNTAFHEVNFAHQLAMFCFNTSRDNRDCLGFIGVRPPVSFGLKDVVVWAGKRPTYTLDSSGKYIVAGSGDNGTGLLGNKFMGGRFGFRSNVAYGGFIATEEGYPDGTELVDRGGIIIDIGRHLNVCAHWVRLFNAWDTSGRGYVSNMAAAYAGMVSTLDPKDAPTNKNINVVLPYVVRNALVNDLITERYIVCQSKPKGTVVVDAPTAARPESDFRRLTTVKICKLILDDLRAVLDPFIGKAGGSTQQNAMESVCRRKLLERQKEGYIQLQELNVNATRAERIAGLATVYVSFTPALETRQIDIVLSLREENASTTQEGSQS